LIADEEVGDGLLWWLTVGVEMRPAALSEKAIQLGRRVRCSRDGHTSAHAASLSARTVGN
jgi:hypothetical protein